MFNTLDSTWDRSARRRWTTVASFGLQAMAVSLLMLVPLVWVQGPPKLLWFDPSRVLVPPPAPAPPSPPAGTQRHPVTSTNISDGHLIPPTLIPDRIADFKEQPQVAAAPNLDAGGVPGGTNVGGRDGVWRSMGPNVALAPPPAPAPTQPLKVSHWAEGNLTYRVQPVYPPLARQARIQGTVLLRAVVSKAGTIENLTAVSGHPMLIPAALNAVRQWRYRPYMLNGEPIEVETEVTVNFVLGGS